MDRRLVIILEATKTRDGRTLLRGCLSPACGFAVENTRIQQVIVNYVRFLLVVVWYTLLDERTPFK